MTPQTKAPQASDAETPRGGPLYRVAIVGAASLKGKEVAEVLGERNFPSVDIKLLDDDESLGQLEAVQDEVSFIQKLRAEEFDHVDFTFFACDAESTRNSWQTAQKAGSAIIDLSYALEDEPGASVRSPWLERQLGSVSPPELQPGPAVVAHPAAVVLGLLLLRVQKAVKLSGIVSTVLEPASEHGQKGMDELHEQTVNLLSFQQLPKAVFDTQVAFNLVSRYGEQSHPSLMSIEERVLKHYARITNNSVPMPSLLLIQAPTFHGHAFALHLEMEDAIGIEVLSRALAGEHVTVVQRAEEGPSNVSAAGQGDILVSVVPDPTRPNAAWLWATADNLRVAAATAVECAEGIAATRPRGSIQ